jgi:hypothetical protein
MKLPKLSPEIGRWLLLAVVALVVAGVVQRDVERRRIAGKLTWTDPENKEALEVGFLALGGFRGIVADVLWVRASRLQEAGKYYELKLLCDLIQKLQPTFAQVNAFQAWNMSYNLSRRGATCEDKWYWVRSGLAVLERGIERNKQNYNLWFELGWTYVHRMSDDNLETCESPACQWCTQNPRAKTQSNAERSEQFRQDKLPKMEAFPEEKRTQVFSSPDNWPPDRAGPSEHLRWAAYYFWRSMQTGTDPNPLRTERVYGHCLERLRLFDPPRGVTKKERWNDWGAEEWWVEVLRRNREERGWIYEPSVPVNLRWCMYMQIEHYQNGATHWKDAGNEDSANLYEQKAQAAYQRLLKHFPEEKRSMEECMKEYYARRDTGQKFRSKQSGAPAH